MFNVDEIDGWCAAHEKGTVKRCWDCRLILNLQPFQPSVLLPKVTKTVVLKKVRVPPSFFKYLKDAVNIKSKALR